MCPFMEFSKTRGPSFFLGSKGRKLRFKALDGHLPDLCILMKYNAYFDII